jgi:hypothetical protein
MTTSPRGSTEALLSRSTDAPGVHEEEHHYPHPLYDDHMAGLHDHVHFGYGSKSIFSPYHPNSVWKRSRRQVQRFQSSKVGHYSILGLVALDVASIFADLFITLYLCDHKEAKGWVATQEALGIIGLVFSSLFVLELLLSIWAFGPG